MVNQHPDVLMEGARPRSQTRAPPPQTAPSDAPPRPPPGELLSTTSYRARLQLFVRLAAAAAAVADARAAAGRAARKAYGWKAGGPGVTTVCDCAPKDLLRLARDTHHARLVYLHREDHTAVALSYEFAKAEGQFVRSSEDVAAADAAAPAAAVPLARSCRRWRSTAHAIKFRAMLDRTLGGGAYLALSYEELARMWTERWRASLCTWGCRRAR